MQTKAPAAALAAQSAHAVRKIPAGETGLGLTPRQWATQVRDATHERRAEMAQDFAFSGDYEAASDARRGAFDGAR